MHLLWRRATLSSVVILPSLTARLGIWTSNFSARDVVSKRSNSSSLAASDLYGTGIRVGVYLQSVGMFLASIPGGSKRAGAGVKLASSANIIAILAAWTILVHYRNISPCEAWLIITLMNMLSVAAGMTLYNNYRIDYRRNLWAHPRMLVDALDIWLCHMVLGDVV